MDDETSDKGPWGDRAPPPEPLFNAPWPSLAIVVAIVGSYVWQTTLGGGDAAVLELGFAPIDLERGRWWSALTVMFVHGGWTHALMNALAALTFGPPVARLIGRSAPGVLVFFVFYLVCGVLSSLGYAVLHLHDQQPVIGASGAVSGLMGGASRLMGGRGQVQPLWSRPVVGFGMSWVLVNLLMAVVGGAPLMPGARIAWEAHIVGFAAGALLLEPFARLGALRLSRKEQS